MSKAQKQHGIVYPSSAVHISTIPLKLAQKLKKEAVSGTSQVAQLRTPKKQKESISISEYRTCNFKRIREADKINGNKNNVYQVILIEEGLGNFKDGFFYTKQALQQAAETGLFDGAQSFADHPSEIEDEVRPERSTRDILGYYEKVQYQESEEGQGQLIANLCVSNIGTLDWANSLLTNSLEYATKFQEKDLVGLSINASGSADPIGIDEFIQSSELSDSVLNKLMEAKHKGLTEIKIVNQLSDAQSVDLVTKAGAGGRVLKMLEQERSMAKKKIKESEHESHQSEDGGAPMPNKKPAGGGDGPTPDHADADQDQALFAKMIKQYLGKDGDQEEMEMAKHAYQAHKEAGMEHEQAYEAAGKHLQMAMEIGKKMAQNHQSESTETENESESESEGHHESESENQESQSPPPNPKEGKKESMKVAQLAGEVAKMRESLKKYELKDYLESKLKNSGESNSVTKKFREALGVAKSKDHVDSTWNIFMKAYKAGAEEVSESEEALFLEKNTQRTNSENVGMSFEGCLRED